MSPRSILVCITLFLFGIIASAQYTEKINSNRPGTSQGAFSVGNNVLQLEGGMGFGKEKHKIFDTKTNVFNFDYAVRYGLLIEQLELRLRGRFRADGVKQTIGGNEEKIRRSDFEINTLGAKYLIYDPYKPKPKKNDTVPANYDSLKSWKEHHKFRWKTLIPAVSVYAGANFVSADNPFTFPEDPTFSPIFAVITQNNWSTSYGGDWAFVTNIIIDKITTDNPAIGWIFTATHTVNDKWAGFVEYQGQKSDFYSDNIMRLGGAYLYNRDLQFDANVAFNFKDTPSIFTVSFGASYRFDWHSKDEIIEKAGLEKEKEEEDQEGEQEGEDGIEGELDEIEEIENDSLKQRKTPFVNTFEDDSFREELERDLDERRTEERLERERIEQEKIDKKEGKKLKKEEARRLKREAKEAREAEKAAIKAEKEKQKMIDEIDAELDKMEKEQGVDGELDDIDKQLQELDKLEKELDQEEGKEKEKEKKAEEKKEEELDVDAEYEKYQKEKDKAQKEEEKRRKKEEKKRLKEEKKRKKEEEKRNNQQNKEDNENLDIDKELDLIDN